MGFFLNEICFILLFHRMKHVTTSGYNVQEYNLDPSIVNVTQENMQKLVKAGQDLLEQPVKIQNVTSFDPYEKPSEGNNDEALKRFVHSFNIFII